VPRVRLVHWNAAEARQRVERLQVAGYEATYDAADGPDLLSQLRGDPPAAVVIDLSRQPSHGRDIALAIRQYKATRRVPLVFVDGDADRVARIRELLPDAMYTVWSQISVALERAIASPLPDPVVPVSRMAGYAGVPLVTKLGIKAGAAVALIDAPPGFEGAMGELPEGVMLTRQLDGHPHLAIWFVRSRQALERQIERMATLADRGGLWIAWPKKASGFDTDLSQGTVHQVALATGLVDYKVCAIDATWSGLRFSRRT
jgi:CheY-like chemotaxis protein